MKTPVKVLNTFITTHPAVIGKIKVEVEDRDGYRQYVATTESGQVLLIRQADEPDEQALLKKMYYDISRYLN